MRTLAVRLRPGQDLRRERLRREGDFEIVALTGTLALAGIHLHLRDVSVVPRRVAR